MLNMQNVKDIEITEGNVRTIHDKDNKLIWGRLAYDTKYDGDTEQQTYTGKNLLSPSSIHNGAFFTTQSFENEQWTETSNTKYRSIKIDNLPAGTYVASINWNYTARFLRYYSNGAVAELGTDRNTYTFTTTTTGSFGFCFRNTVSTDFDDSAFTIQLEVGSTATSYEPYVGGVPSPNPDYPQDVNVVTGTQTVTISDGVDSEDYTISLGTIELCKIGTYQDYIYKSGDEWYVHKATGKVELDGSNDETWGVSNSGTPNFFYRYQYLTDAKIPAEGFSNIAIQTGINSSNTDQGFDYTTGGEFRIRYGTQKTVSEWRSFLSSTPMALYYPLATPTDTQITDTNLIMQLNNIHQFLTRYGYNSNVTGNLPIIINQTSL